MKSPFRSVFGRRSTQVERYLTVLIIVYSAVVGFQNPRFLSLETVFDIVHEGAPTMILAIGVLLVLISGGIDVSFPVVAICSAYVSIKLMWAFGLDALWFMIPVSIVIGLLLGLINALLIHFLKLPTLIVTLGTMSVYRGFMAITLGTSQYPVATMPKSLAEFGLANIVSVEGEGSSYGLSVFFPIVVVIFIVTWFILYHTMLGRAVFALGSDEEAASRIGVNLLRTRLFVYGYTGAIAGMAGLMYFAAMQNVDPVALQGFELMVIAAVVIGGAKLTGGEGTILGTFLGVLLFQLFQSTLVQLGLASTWASFFFGAVLLFSLAMIYYRQRKSDQRNLVFRIG
ncbi:MAG: ABC transporter permease [Propionibacteriaceae bacterium]|jgi:simple sugar transport system permease protein|nr:ABC transporter permease [Propionibacteriaceae bacterium]